jgi:phosphoribosylglycinamide formyltransferase-1
MEPTSHTVRANHVASARGALHLEVSLTMNSQLLKIGVLASHEGMTLQCILDACTAGRIRGEVVAVISNNGGSGALTRARTAGIPAHHLSSVTHPTPDSLDAAIRAALSAAQVDVVFLAGYLKRLGSATLRAFQGRVLNTHPALLPKFGGQGMFGDHVFEAVLASGESETGVSVHLVDGNYDTGQVIRQVRVPVETKDCVESFKARVQECERDVVVQTLAAIATGELRLAAAG